MDGGISVPIPDTPGVDLDDNQLALEGPMVPNGGGSSLENGGQEGGLELIGQEMVIRRTLRQTPARSEPAAIVDVMAPNSNPTAYDLRTPVRNTVSSQVPLAVATSGDVMERDVVPGGQTGWSFPKGSPVVFGPMGMSGASSQPLFNQDQLRRLHELQQQAPSLYGNVVGREFQNIPRPQSLPREEGGYQGFQLGDQRRLVSGLQGEYVGGQRRGGTSEGERTELRREIRRLEEEHLPLRASIQSLKEENELLRIKLNFVEGPTEGQVFLTPDRQTSMASGEGRHLNGASISNSVKNVPVPVKLIAPVKDEVVDGLEVPVNDRVPQNVKVVESEDFVQNVSVPVGLDAQNFEAVPDYDIRGRSGGAGRSERSKGVREEPQESQSSNQMLQLMAKMMEGMTNLQKQIIDGKDHEQESVRSNLELPPLPEWSASSGPVDLSDWLCIIEPLMADLSSSSAEWWSVLMTEAQHWYGQHLKLQPLERVSHEAVASAELTAPKWARLERRASTMLLMSLPQNLREELVSTKRVSALRIVCHLMMIYQPGGLAEKELILRQLEMPPESGSLAEAVQGLRKWTRWRHRASDLGVQEPDPFLLLKGLNRLTKKPLEQHRDLSFRISLARSTLQVDSTPTSRSVTSFALHLIAEFEQVVYHETNNNKKASPTPKEIKSLKAKKLEEEGEKAERRAREEAGEKDQLPCRFYLSRQGCRKGKECKYSHDQKDDLRRCYVCGASEHIATTCPRKKGDGANRHQPRAARVETGETATSPDAAKEDQMVNSTSGKEGEPTVKGLLEEATKVLKSISTTPSTPSTAAQTSGGVRDEMMANLQRQLDQLRSSAGGGSVKSLKLSKITVGASKGLIDSGATHALRPIKPNENREDMRPVEVTLADGNRKSLLINNKGTMIAPTSEVEPIIPMGIITSRLGCEVRWIGEEIQVIHPTRGSLEVWCEEGCPTISQSLALELIDEAEKVRGGSTLKKLNLQQEQQWMDQLIHVHPVLRELPGHIKSNLAVNLGEWGDLPLNKRMRRKYQKEGFVVHLFAGEDHGHTLRVALDQVGGKNDNLLEVDILRNESHDVLKNDGIYGGLLRTAVEGSLLGVLGGPNCRTRSVLRHYPIEGCPDAPRPVRSWKDDQVYGLHQLSAEEQEKVREDDLLLWRMIFLYMVASYVHKAKGRSSKVGFLLEQPSSPKSYMEDCVSLWDQQDWMKIAEEFDLEHLHIKQGDYGGLAVKPTTLANNLDLEPAMPTVKSRGKVGSSKELSRWAPGMMNLVAIALKTKIFNQCGALRALTWNQHLENNHVPFRRDCKICQESLQRDKPHRRIKHPMCGVLSLDTSGPFKTAPDMIGKAKYLLVGTLTWMVPVKSSIPETPEDEDDSLPEGAPDFEEEVPALQDEEDIFDEEAAQLQKKEGEVISGGALGNDGGFTTRDSAESEPNLLEESGEGGEQVQEDPPKDESYPEEPPKDFEVRTYRMVLPMTSKASPEVTKTVMEFILRLRIEGYHISRVHTDRGREFSTHMRKWLTSRGVVCTRTAGDNPQSNGRAEAAIQSVKNLIRRLLLQADQGPELWPWAARYLNETFHYQRVHQEVNYPQFGSSILVNKRTWKNRQFEAVKEEVKYLCPAWSEHGHWVRKEGHQPVVTRYVLQCLDSPPADHHWIALERDALGTLEVRRRIRGKSTIRRIALHEEEDEGEKQREYQVMITKIIEEEMSQLIHDETSIAILEFQILSKLRKLSEVKSEEEEVLQTKVISPKEVSDQWHEWIEAANEEVQSMIEEKQALKALSKEELESIIRKAHKNGRKVEMIPSKLVFTRKPATNSKGYKNKVRWVVCGNFEAKKEGEENYSSGADAASFRLLVHYASKHQWSGGSVDVKTAFLNADLNQQETEDVVIIKPPNFFVEKKLMDRAMMYQPLKAVYGFRRSPRLWGQCRDETLETLEIPVVIDGREQILMLTPMRSEPNLWMIKRKQDIQSHFTEGSLHGLLMTYVDDTFVVGSLEVVNQTLQEIQKVWKTSDPERVSEIPIKFLGMQVSKYKEGESSEEIWRVDQESYVKDLLSKEEVVKQKTVPITRDQCSTSVPQQLPTVEAVRLAQREVGSLLWLVTRTRPDIMYAVSRMSALVTKDPLKVVEISSQVKGYLKATISDGLIFRKSDVGDATLNVFSDASYAPEGDCSHGCSIALLQSSPILWKSGRQSMITLSTAEAELLEAVEAMTMGESISVMVEEIESQLQRMAWCDSQAAVAILTTEGGSWRTRHLRIRSSYARSSIQQGRWSLHHIAGVNMVADVGTKPLTAARIQQLKKGMGMASRKEDREKSDDLVEASESQGEVETMAASSSMTSEVFAQALRLLAVAAAIQVAEASPEEVKESEEGAEEMWWLIYIYTIVVVLITIAVRPILECLCKKFSNRQPSLKNVENEEKEDEKSSTGEGDEVSSQGEKPRTPGQSDLQPPDDLGGIRGRVHAERQGSLVGFLIRKVAERQLQVLEMLLPLRQPEW